MRLCCKLYFLLGTASQLEMQSGLAFSCVRKHRAGIRVAVLRTLLCKVCANPYWHFTMITTVI